jgi:uncharacterized RDD family membrane protein YckC
METSAQSQASVGYNPYAPPTAGAEYGGPGLGAEGPDHILAGRGTRLAAVMIDTAVMLGVALPGGLLLGIGVGSESDALAIAGGCLLGLCILGLAIYQIYLISTTGQSLAKKWMGIRIIKVDGSPCGFVHGVLLRSWVMALIGNIPLVGPIASLVDPLLIFGDERRCLHDMIAGTKVVIVS